MKYKNKYLNCSIQYNITPNCISWKIRVITQKKLNCTMIINISQHYSFINKTNNF